MMCVECCIIDDDGCVLFVGWLLSVGVFCVYCLLCGVDVLLCVV